MDTDRWAEYLMDADGSSPRLLVDDTDSGNPAWSPDGKQIVGGRYSYYAESGGEESRLVIVDVATGAETPAATR